jgi:hypothetical protein
VTELTGLQIANRDRDLKTAKRGGTSSHAGTMDQARSGTLPAPPLDLIDFHRRWREFRPACVALMADHRVAADERSTLLWLIALADRVSEADVRSS